MKTLAMVMTAALIFAACGRSADMGVDGSVDSPVETLTIYGSGPLGNSDYEDVLSSVEIALEQRHSRVGNVGVRFISLDDAGDNGQWDQARVRENATRAAQDPTAIAYIGDFNSGATAIAMPILNTAGILHVSPTSTATALTRESPVVPGSPAIYAPSAERTFGRVIPSDWLQGYALGHYMELEAVKSVFIVKQDDVYGLGLAHDFSLHAEEDGIEIVGQAIDSNDAVDASIAATVKDSGAQAVLYTGTAEDATVRLARAILEENPEILFFAGDGMASNQFTAQLSEYSPNLYFTTPVIPLVSHGSHGREFFESFEEKERREPIPVAFYGYETMHIVLDALDTVQADGQLNLDDIASSRRAAVDAYFAIVDRVSPLGGYSIDRNGDADLRLYGAYRAEEGRLVKGRTLTLLGVP